MKLGANEHPSDATLKNISPNSSNDLFLIRKLTIPMNIDPIAVILEEEVNSTLTGAIDWVNEVVPTHFTRSELSTLKTLVNT